MRKLFYPMMCLLICTTQAHAKQYFTGVFLTGALGATSVQYTVNQELDFGVPGFHVDVPENINLSATAPAIMGSVGYSYQFKNNFLLGTAFTAGYTNAKVNDTPSVILRSSGDAVVNFTSDMEIKLINDFALLLKGGYVFATSTLFYTFIGPRWGNFSSSVETDVYFDEGFAGVLTGSGSASNSRYQVGFTAGLGIQQLISPSYSWALEYAYTGYGKLDGPSTTGTLALNGIPQSNAVFSDSPSIDASTNTLMFTASIRY